MVHNVVQNYKYKGVAMRRVVKSFPDGPKGLARAIACSKKVRRSFVHSY